MSVLRFKIFILLVLSFNAAADNVRLGGGLGRANIDLDEKYTFDDPDSGDDSLAYYFYTGYSFNNNFFVDLNIEYAVDYFLLKNASDSTSFFAINLATGYTFDIENFYIEPTLGYSDWRLESKEGALFNPGPEETKEIEGGDFFGAIAVGYKFSRVFGMSLSYKALNAGFGSYESTYLNFDFSI